LALALAMAMVLSMGTMSAFAAGEGEGGGEGGETPPAQEETLTAEYIKLDSSDTHTYKVFQVLTGTLANEGDKNLGDPAWGADAIADHGDLKTFIDSLEGKTEQQIADLVAAKVDTTGDGRGTVSKDSPIQGLAKGYYVLVDTTDLTSEDFKNDTKALNVVKVVNNIDALAIKHGTTEDDKTITGDTLGENGNTFTTGKNQDNVSVGDTVHYNIAATVPDNADKFKAGTFFFVITDKLSSGLTFTDGSLEVYDGETKLTANTHYTVQYNINNNTFEVGLINAASYKGKTINVKYDAVLNQNAVIGDAGNTNTSTVKFSNDPNKTYEGSPEDQNHPGFPDSTKEVPTGETPESETKTYTTGIEIQKVDQDGKVLTGATFKISGDSVKTVLKVTQSFTEAADGDYYKLKDGTYTKTAPSTEETMVEAEAGATAGYVVDASYEGDDKKVIGGTTYRPYDPETDTDVTVYVLKEGNADLYDSTDTKYKKSETKTAEDTTTKHEASQAVDSNGLARFDGLGAGSYTITETATPSGYNTVAPVTLDVQFNENGTAKFSATGATYEDGVLKIRVENQKGSTLPETGGIGTTIFYIAGAILVIGASVVMITRRRMDA